MDDLMTVSMSSIAKDVSVSIFIYSFRIFL